MRAMTSEFVVPESSEERRLWTERGLLEVQIGKKEKMMDNTRALLKGGWGVQGRQTLSDEADELEREMWELREEITLVDREIRAAEKDGWKEMDGSKEMEEARTKESKARQKEECFRALVQARMRMEADGRKIDELEGKLREMGGL